ncbi:SMI1/KNR4 family protein [Polyangium jinanense]|uniref:SMI1/KNR4 family protein n=1 Tax=Polyangium jinanense TaxID=2829994 RepID=A0A9X3X285_9BACT|nr:SMI1/KNR4 family protein [Polyangium jinanense]MDC3955159.1 SMI1/KNR4 family protein [Polyangium jinanense]MDC3981460.1 SMI1/KNR4 family protein [Polyangium jinanense]
MAESPREPYDAIVTSIDDVPVARVTADALMRLPAHTRAWPIVVSAEDVQSAVEQAVAGLTVVPLYEGKTIEGLSDAESADLREMASTVIRLLSAELASGIYRTKHTYAYITGSLVATSHAEVRKRLAAAGLRIASLAEVLATLPREPESNEAAVASVGKTFEAPMREYLATGGPISEELRDASKMPWHAYLTKAVERWNPEISGRILDLWLATRGEDVLGTAGYLPLEEDAKAPELGFDRTQALADMLAARGLSPVLSGLTAARAMLGPSADLLCARWLANPASFSVDALGLPLAQAALAAAVGTLLRAAPSVRARVEPLLAEHHPAFGLEALKRLLDYDDGHYAKRLDDAHLATAANGAKLVDLLNLASKVDELRGTTAKERSAKSFVLEAWGKTVTTGAFAQGVSDALGRLDKGVIDSQVVWEALTRGFQDAPHDPLGIGDAPPFALYLIVRQLAKPKGAAKSKLVAWCEAHPNGLGAYTATFAKKVGDAEKPAPPPYDPADLAGLPSALAKAWKSAREKSWKVGVRLPAGASAKILAAAEKAFEAPLPEDVRSFYVLHDGAGEDECFRSCRLYSMAEALEERAMLRSLADVTSFPAEWLPVTDDGAGNHACVVMRGKNVGEVFDFDHETGPGRRLAKSFASFVERGDWE